MPSYDFTVQDHDLTTEYAYDGSRYLVRCTCGWTSPHCQRWEAERWGNEHVSERQRALEAAREKTRYVIREEP
jgi:hypothetical protein